MVDRLAQALTLGLPLLLLAAAACAAYRPSRATVPLLLGVALADAVAGVVILPLVRQASAEQQAVILGWSPLGLYGVELSVRTHALGSFLAAPCVVAALVGWVRAYGAPWADLTGSRAPAGRPGVDASMLAALAGGAWAVVAGDLVSIVLGTGALFVATSAALLVSGAAVAARRRVLVTGALALGLLTCTLLLGKVNGTFATSQLASVSFSDASLAGLVAVAYGVGSAVPFHGWSLVLARQPLMPAVAAAGGAVSLSLVDLAFVTTGGELAREWRAILTVLGLLAILGAVWRSWSLRQPRLRLATLVGGRTGLALLALSSGAPATMSALALLHGVAATGSALLWVASPGASGSTRGLGRRRVDAGAAHLRTSATYVPLPPTVLASALGAAPVSTGGGSSASRAPGTGSLPTEVLRDLRPEGWRSAGPWLVVLTVATAAGIPGTAGGLAADTYLSALVASNDAGTWLRLAALVLDTAVIGAGGAILGAGIDRAILARVQQERRARRDRPGWSEPDDGWRTRPTVLDVIRATLPWAGVAVGIAVVVAPAVLPATFVAPWFTPVSVAMAGTSTPPRLVDALRVASPDRIVLGIAAVVALLRTQRGEELLPAPARAALGVAVLLASPAMRAWAAATGRAGRLAHDLGSAAMARAERATLVARLVEERYYAAVAVVLVVVFLYGVGR